MNKLQQDNTTQGFIFSRRFMPIFLTQFFGALNDNVFKQVLLLLISYGWLQSSTDTSLLTNLVALLFILPFFIFSATAGQIADRYERSQLIRKLKLLEIIIMLIACVGLFTSQIWLLLVAIFLMGAQSTFFGPIKYAILPEILSEKELVSGNAIFQAGTSLAILLGMLLGGVLIYFSFTIPLAILVIAILGYLSSQAILPQRIVSQDIQINWNFLQTSKQTLQYAHQLPLIFIILLGNSWYWFYGASLLTQIPEMTKEHLFGSESIVSLLLTTFSIGVGIGSFICQKFGKNKPLPYLIKLIVVGAIGLSLFAVYLAWALSIVPQQTQLIDLNNFFTMPIYYHSLIATTALGVVGGFYIVPLYTMMQQYSPASHRARVVAANNILNAIFMVSSAVFSILILTVLDYNIPTLFSLLSILNLVFFIYLITRLKQHLATHHP